MKPYRPDEPLVFIHVPKSAGTSVQALFRSWYPDRLSLHYFDEPSGTPPTPLGAGALADRANPPVVYGHFNRLRGFGVEHSYPTVRQFATILRDPFETAVSAYFFTRRVAGGWKHAPAVPGALDQWLDTTPPNILNHFPRPVTRDNYKALIEEWFVHVGVVEALPVALAQLARTLGKPYDPAAAPPTENASPRDQAASPGARDRYRSRHPLEFDVYEHVRGLSLRAAGATAGLPGAPASR